MSSTAGQRALAEIAQMQWGLVSRRQAGAAGVPLVQLSRLAQRGLLERTASTASQVRPHRRTKTSSLRGWHSNPARPSALVVGDC